VKIITLFAAFTYAIIAIMCGLEAINVHSKHFEVLVLISMSLILARIADDLFRGKK